MKILDVTVNCRAVYNGAIEVPDDFTEEQAIAYAKEHIGEISCGNLELVKGSQTLDEDNCSFADVLKEEDKRSPEEIEKEEKAVAVWDLFDDTMSNHGYSLILKTPETQEEERVCFGKVFSSLGTIASKDDRFAPIIRLYITSQYKSMTIFVEDRNGSGVLSGRQIGLYRLSEISIDVMRKALKYILGKYEAFGEGNYIPHNIESEEKTF